MLVADAQSYAHLRSDTQTLVRSQATYPELVFTERHPHYYFMENSVGRDWELLRAFFSVAGDERVVQFCVEPSGEDFWKPRTGHFGCFELPTTSTAEEWNWHLNFANDAYKTTIYTWPGRSAIYGNRKQWAMFVDISFDLAVVGSFIDLSEAPSCLFKHYVHDVDWAIQYWRATGSRLDDDFYVLMKNSYPPDKGAT